jgi:hypothetical protein
MDVDNAPREIWIPTYGTDSLFDDWFADPDMACEDDVKYIRADIVEHERTAAIEAEAAVWLKGVNHLIDKQTELDAEIRRLEDIIAQMSDEVVDAWEAGEEGQNDTRRYQTLTIVQPPGRQYLATLNGCRVYLNGKELSVSNIEIRAGHDRLTVAVITMPVHLVWVDEEVA